MPDITITFQDGSKHVYKNVPDNVTPEQAQQRASTDFPGLAVTALDRTAEPKPNPGALKDELLRKGSIVTGGLARGALSLPALMAEGAAAFNDAERGPVGKKPKTLSSLIAPEPEPAYNELSRAVQSIGTNPETVSEKYLASASEGVGGSLLAPSTFARPVANTVIGLSSGLGAEAGAQALGDNAVSRVIGALLFGAPTAAAVASKPNADKLLRQATEQVPDAAWRRAFRTEATLKETGIPHLKSQLLGEGSTLPDLVSVASQHPSVRPKLVTAVEKAPEQSRMAFERWKNQNLPISMDETRSVLSDVQGFAKGRIDDIGRSANQAYVSKLSPGVSAETYSPEQVRKIAETLRQSAADPNKFGPLTAGGQFMTRLADDIEGTIAATAILGPNGKPLEKAVPKGFINNLLKDLNTRAEKEGFKGLSMDEVKTVIRQATPEFSAARGAKKDVIDTVLNPAKKGLLGQIADLGGGVRPDKTTASVRAIDIVFPKDQRQPDAILELGKQVGGERVGELLREHLARSMEQSVRLTGEAGRMQQSFDFVKAIAGTNAQRQNLEAALKVSSESIGANPAAVRNGFYKLMRAFETAKDLKLPASVDRAALQQQAGLNAPGLLVAPQSRLGRVFWEKATEKTFKQIADIVLAPDGLKQLEAIAKAPGYSAASAYARSVLASSMPSEQEEVKP